MRSFKRDLRGRFARVAGSGKKKARKAGSSANRKARKTGSSAKRKYKGQYKKNPRRTGAVTTAAAILLGLAVNGGRMSNNKRKYAAARGARQRADYIMSSRIFG